jgi:predicted N-formylglutamate amidohydrolase
MSLLKQPFFIVTCEHATNYIPAQWVPIPGMDEQVLQSHRAWDPGALEMAFQWSQFLHAPIFRGFVSRLLIDLNRSEQSPQLFSEFSYQLTDLDRENLRMGYHDFYRRPVQAMVKSAIEMNYCVIHISLHSFTPVFHGCERSVEVGLLFDPTRRYESRLCHSWSQEFSQFEPFLQVRWNEPYHGTDDGFTTDLRLLHPDDSYLGIELEINQKFSLPRMLQISENLCRSFEISRQQIWHDA